MNPATFPIPFPRTMPDGKTIILDELCYCGATRSAHNGAGPMFGCGACESTHCRKFTWKEWVTGRAAFAPAGNPDGKGWILGLAVAGEHGYHPRPDLGAFGTYELAMASAQEKNSGLGLSIQQAFRIVASTMRSSSAPKRRRA